uniref:Putative hhh secreted protein n=1 Tax=Psorophora albipes TaxID=869069 RepID=T1DJ63_9DIPT
MKFLLVAFLVTIAALVAIALPHHNGTSTVHHHHHHPGGQWNGTDAAGGQFNRTFPGGFRPPRRGGFFWPWRNNSRPAQPRTFDFVEPAVLQPAVQEPIQDVV